VPLPKINPIKEDFTIEKFRDPIRPRKPVAVSLGPHLDGISMPHPDDDPNTAAAGVCARFGRAPPEPDKDKLERFGRFVADFISKNLTPLAPDTDVTFETWLEKTKYPRWRKRELERARVDILKNKKYYRCKSFIKDEFYPTFKHARGINSRTDEFKCAVGPWFKAIEEVVFKMDYFIKKIPVSKRAAFIYNKLYRNGATYLASDYTSFEALFTKEIMEKCEFQLYKYMTQFIPDHEEFWRLLDEVLASENHCYFRDFVVKLRATRMSGEMCTSLGNGFSNLMFILFLCHELGSEVDGVVEGDDGLFVIKGPIPSEKDFENLGLRVKLEVHHNLSEASFCGLIFDEEDLVNVTEPLGELAAFGLGTHKYLSAKTSTHMSLLRCKSMSMVYQYPGCPILQELGLYGLRQTTGFDHRVYMNSRHMSMWEREQLLTAEKSLKNLAEVVRDIPLKTRLLVEKKFNVSVESQLSIEKVLREKKNLDPIQLTHNFPREWEVYFENFSTIEDVKNIRSPVFDIPRNLVSAGQWKDLFA